MSPALMMTLSVLVPFACLGLLLLLSWLEDTLARDVKKAERRRVPAPIIAVPAEAPVQTASTDSVASAERSDPHVVQGVEPVKAETEKSTKPTKPTKAAKPAKPAKPAKAAKPKPKVSSTVTT